MSDGVSGLDRSGRSEQRGVLDWLTRLYPVPPPCVPPLLGSGVVLGVAGDVLLRAPDLPGLNPDRASSIRSWNGSTMRASDGVRQHQAQLRSIVGSEPERAASSRVE
jgi:hypothetical protein